MAQRALTFLLFAIAVGGGAVLLSQRPSGADGAPRHSVYVSITGEGSTAKAWYRGGPPTGTSVQDVFDALSKDGYHVAAVTAGERPVVVSTQSSTSPLLPERQYLVVFEK